MATNKKIDRWFLWVIIIILVVVILINIIIYFSVKNKQDSVNENEYDVTWSTITGEDYSSWDIIPVNDFFSSWQQTNIDTTTFEYIIKNTEDFIELPFSEQNIQSYWNYQINTQWLKSYAKNNMKNFHIPEDAVWWYLYIKLRKTLPNNRSAVIYIETDWRHCWWWIKNSNDNINYIYLLTSLDLVDKACDWNWLTKIKWKDTTIWWYVWTFDWNWIEKITIARYF